MDAPDAGKSRPQNGAKLYPSRLCRRRYIVFERRAAEGKLDRLPGFIDDLLLI
jgi:hypothetical protein